MKQEFIPIAKFTIRSNTRPFIVAQAGSVLLNLLKLQVLELQDEEKAKNLLRYLANMRLKMMEDLTPVDEAKFTLDLSVKKNVSYI